VEKNGEIVPKDLREIEIVKPEDLLEAAKRVQRERKIGETRMNKESSRSHTILRIVIESVDNEDITSAVLSFIDLAGSEKASQTGATGVRLKEAGHINKSLSHLSYVIMNLSGANLNQCSAKKPNLNASSVCSTASQAVPNTTVSMSATSSKILPTRFINFRDSKLTRLLQSSLNGNAYISIICNITPASSDETASTLR